VRAHAAFGLAMIVRSIAGVFLMRAFSSLCLLARSSVCSPPSVRSTSGVVNDGRIVCQPTETGRLLSCQNLIVPIPN
jgi:hypothetical protein